MSSFLLSLVQNPQDVEEQIDHVKVDVDGGHDVVLGRHLVHEEMDVVDEEEAEEDGAADGDDELQWVRVWDEKLEEATDDQDHESSEKSCTPWAEVSPALDCVDNKTEGDG